MTRWAVWVLACTAAASGALAAVVVAAGADAGLPLDELAVGVAVLTYTAVAVLIEAARRGHRVARVMLVGATAWGVGEGLLAVGVHGYRHDPGSVPAAELLAVLGTASRGFGWLVLILVVPLLFPDGRVPWGSRVPVAVASSGLVAFTAATLLAPTPMEYRLEGMDSPTGLPAHLQPVVDVLALSALAICTVALLVAVAGLVHRWRTGDALRRQQLLWLCVAFALPVVFLPLIGTDLVAPWMFAVVSLPVPIAIAVAMLQHRLYDVQWAVSRTLTYVALSGAVAVLYALTVGGVGALLRERGAPWLPWVATGVVAVSFAPLHQLLRQAVNRLTYGQWSRPHEVLATTGRRIADAADVPHVLGLLVRDLGTSLRLPYVDICDADGRCLTSHGALDGTAIDQLALTAYGMPVGALRWGRRPLRERDQRLLEDLAHQVGGVVHAAGLLESLRRGQHALVLAREEERRRLRRDLHDGLGPTLASLTLQVDTLRNVLQAGGKGADEHLLRLRTAIQAAVVDVRRIVEGLRPPALDELGLPGALAEWVEQNTSDDMEVDLQVAGSFPPLPAAVEVALYRVTQEALTNVVRHSSAVRASVRIRASDEAVHLVVEDEGVGGAHPSRCGVGLTTMRERVQEVNGTLSVSSPAGTGTRIEVRLPTGQPALQPAGPVAL